MDGVYEGTVELEGDRMTERGCTDPLLIGVSAVRTRTSNGSMVFGPAV